MYFQVTKMMHLLYNLVRDLIVATAPSGWLPASVDKYLLFRVDPPNSPTLHSLLYFSVSVFCISVNLYVCIFNFFESTLPTHLTFCISLFSFFLICIFVFVFVCLSISIFVFSTVLRWPSQLSFTALGLILFASFYYARVLQRLYFLLGKS